MLPATAVTAWAGGPTTPTSPVTLTPDMISLSWTTETYTGADIKAPEVTVKAGDTTYTSNTDYTVAVDPETIKNAGDYKITVTPKENSGLTGNAITKVVTVNPADFSKAVITYTGSKLKKDFTDFDSKKDGDTVSLPGGSSITIANIASDLYDSNYKVTRKDANTVMVTVAKTNGHDNNLIGPVSKFIDINLTSSLEDYKIVGSNKDGSIPAQIYDGGKALKPTVFVVPKDNKNGDTSTGKLTLDKHYTLNYKDNTTGGYTATVTASGIGSYSGEISATFRIDGKSIDKLSIVGNNTVKGEKPTFVVKDGTTVLTEGTDYRVHSYDSSTVGASSGKATLEGISNYQDTKTVSYKVIDPKYVIENKSVELSDTKVLYTGSKQDVTATVTVDSKKLTKGTDYTLTYYDLEATKDADKPVEPKNVSKYSVYVQGKGNYAVKGDSKGLFAGYFEIRPISLDRITVNFSSSTKYDSVSKATVPKVSLKASTGATIPETDYDVSYYRFSSSSSYRTPYVVIKMVDKNKKGTTGQTEVSTGSLTAGTGERQKQIEEDYKGATIDQNNSKNIDVTYDKAYYWKDEKASKTENNKQKVTIKSGDVIDYIGEKVYLDLSVYDRDSRRYLESYEYTVTYKNSAKRTVSYMYDADTYTVIIESTSNYENRYNRNFKVEKTFKITGNDISGYTVTLDKSSVNATGYAITLPKVTKVEKGSTKLSASEYTVSYKDSEDKTVTRVTAPGTYKVVVTGAGKYSGSTYATFRVIGLSQTITGVESSYKLYPNTQNSSTLQLAPKATEAKNFTYTSSDSSIASVSSTGVVTAYKAGRAKITITTTGNTKYDPATFSTVIKVYPKKAVMTRKPWNTGKKGQVKVRWNKQDNVTRYEIRYSRAKNFAKGTYITKKVNAAQNDYTTQSTTLKNLKSGQRYYVKVRAVKEVYNDYGKKLTYYGAWSGWRSVVVK